MIQAKQCLRQPPAYECLAQGNAVVQFCITPRLKRCAAWSECLQTMQPVDVKHKSLDHIWKRASSTYITYQLNVILGASFRSVCTYDLLDLTNLYKMECELAEDRPIFSIFLSDVSWNWMRHDCDLSGHVLQGLRCIFATGLACGAANLLAFMLSPSFSLVALGDRGIRGTHQQQI